MTRFVKAVASEYLKLGISFGTHSDTDTDRRTPSDGHGHADTKHGHGHLWKRWALMEKPGIKH